EVVKELERQAKAPVQLSIGFDQQWGTVARKKPMTIEIEAWNVAAEPLQLQLFKVKSGGSIASADGKGLALERFGDPSFHQSIQARVLPKPISVTLAK